MRAVDLALNAVERQLAPQVEYGPSDRCYAWEPLPAEVFIDGLLSLGASAGRSLVDAGCGIGTKLVMARELGWERLYGLEMRSGYAVRARKLCPDAEIMVGMIEDHDFSSYDVVYMFWPCIDRGDQADLERHVVSTMRPGAVAFFPHAVAMDDQERIADHVWKVG